jgi:hypothetical protein
MCEPSVNEFTVGQKIPAKKAAAALLSFRCYAGVGCRGVDYKANQLIGFTFSPARQPATAPREDSGLTVGKVA